MEPFEGGVSLTVHAPELDLSDVALGDSISHNGACMTVVDMQPDARYRIDVSEESLRVTVGLQHQGGKVNLEKKPCVCLIGWVAIWCRAMWMAWAKSSALNRWATTAS